MFLPIEAAVRRCSSKWVFLIVSQYSQTPVQESHFMFPCEYFEIYKSSFSIEHFLWLLLYPQPVSFLNYFFLTLFVHLYYLFHYLIKTLYLRCISNTYHFFIFLCIVTKLANICSKSTKEQPVKYFQSHKTNTKERRLVVHRV